MQQTTQVKLSDIGTTHSSLTQKIKRVNYNQYTEKKTEKLYNKTTSCNKL